MDLSISGERDTPISESDIRYNYNDMDKIIAAANKAKYSGTSGVALQQMFYSWDGGNSWNNTITLPLANPEDFKHADPAVDWTSDGTAWACTIGYSAGISLDKPNLKIRCYRSDPDPKADPEHEHDTWTYDSTPSGIQYQADREVMWVDHSKTSKYKDQIYVMYHNGQPAFVVRRTAGRTGAWQEPVQVSCDEITGTAIGGDIKTNSAGEVFAIWPDERKIWMAKSTDGGAHFNALGKPIEIATIFASHSRTLKIPAARMLKIPVDEKDEWNPHVYVSGGAYRTKTKDLVYAVWPDLSGDAGCISGYGPESNVASTCKTRIWFSRSTDGGLKWKTTKLFDQASLNDQFHPRLAVDDTNGQLVVIYYDTVNDPGRVKTNVFMQISDDDGVSWSKTAVKITSAETDETEEKADTKNQYGDYIGLTGYSGRFFGSWTDRRKGGSEEIWGRAITTSHCFVCDIFNYLCSHASQGVMDLAGFPRR